MKYNIYSKREQKTCIFLFPVLDENHKAEAEDLNYSSDESHLGGVELEPTDRVVVQDVHNVGEQDQSHSGTESFPDSEIYFNVHQFELFLPTS